MVEVVNIIVVQTETHITLVKIMLLLVDSINTLSKEIKYIVM